MSVCNAITIDVGSVCDAITIYAGSVSDAITIDEVTFALVLV